MFVIKTMAVVAKIGILILPFFIAFIIFSIWVLSLVIRALRKYLRSEEVRKEKSVIRKSLGEVLKKQRLNCQMTQEFVAEAIGVSRQAVTKWENGRSDPSTSNLLALARLYGIPSDELLKSVVAGTKTEVGQ